VYLVNWHRNSGSGDNWRTTTTGQLQTFKFLTNVLLRGVSRVAAKRPSEQSERP